MTTTNAPVPFLDLVTVHRELERELLAVFKSALDTAGFIGGSMVQDFERAFAAFCDARFCIGMANGTDALRLALMATGVRPGDTVVTVPLTLKLVWGGGVKPEPVAAAAKLAAVAPESLQTVAAP